MHGIDKQRFLYGMLSVPYEKYTACNAVQGHNMKVLVTGGAGFIGSHIVDFLIEAGHAPVVVDNFSTGVPGNLAAEVPVHTVDIRDRPALARVFASEQPELVCHQAAQMSVGRSVQQPSYDAEVNLLGLLNTLELAQSTGVRRFVFASSGGVLYGDVSEPADETHPANPISPYGISKWAGEQYLRFFTREHGLEPVALRYSNVYGPRQNPHGEAGVVAIFCQRMRRGEPTVINGDGRYLRDYVYVTDVARANLLALTESLPAPHVAFNVGTGLGLDVNELADLLRRFMQQTLQEQGVTAIVPESSHGPARPGDLRSNLVDASLLNRTWDWKPTWTIEAGLRRTVDWFAHKA